MPRMNILLPDDISTYVRSKVKSGAYASESDVISESLRESIYNEQEMDAWLRNEVVPALEEFERNPGHGFTGDEVRKSVLEFLASGSFPAES